MLGTAAVCGLVEVIISVFPVKVIQRIFPRLVASITVILLGVALTGTGIKYWGGGVVCAEMIWKEHGQLADLEVPAIPGPTCLNGEVALGYGAIEFVGLGFSVICALVLIELFGSVFMKNCSTLSFGLHERAVHLHTLPSRRFPCIVDRIRGCWSIEP